jgi:hypothetical protein
MFRLVGLQGLDMRHRRPRKRLREFVGIRDCLIEAKRHDLSQPLPDSLKRILMALHRQENIVESEPPNRVLLWTLAARQRSAFLKS